MTKEQKMGFIGLLLLWIIVIAIELVWLYITVTSGTNDVGFIAFIITFIACTLIIGLVVTYIIGKYLDNKRY